MKISSSCLAVCTASIGLLVAAVAAGQRAVELTQVPSGGGPAVSKVTQGFSELVTVSKGGDAVWLYSLQTGRWHKQVIPANQGPVSPVVGFGVVAFRTRTMAFACSSQTGAWDSVELGDVPGLPIVGKNMAVIRAGNKLYGFSSETGGWDSVELGDKEVGHPNVGIVAVLETGSKVYAFSPKTGNWAVVDRE
jgi:hypothetical protein